MARWQDKKVHILKKSEPDKAYVIATDELCLTCGQQHGYATTKCVFGGIAVFRHFDSALWVANHVKDGKVAEIDINDLDVNYTLFLHKGGKPDASAPRTHVVVSRS